MRPVTWAAVALGVVVSVPAWALQDPAPVKEDPRVRVIAFNPNQVVNLTAAIGETLTVQFADNAQLQVAASDTAHLKYAVSGNMLWLKATTDMPQQPISVVVRREDGTVQVYLFQWQARADETSPYYLVRFIYPNEVSAARRADAQRRRAELQGRDAERLLHQKNPMPTAGSVLNRNYTATGDLVLLPTQSASVTPVPVTPSPTVVTAQGGRN